MMSSRLVVPMGAGSSKIFDAVRITVGWVHGVPLLFRSVATSVMVGSLGNSRVINAAITRLSGSYARGSWQMVAGRRRTESQVISIAVFLRGD